MQQQNGVYDLLKMLEVNEELRPDFIELQDNIQKIYYHKDKIPFCFQ